MSSSVRELLEAIVGLQQERLNTYLVLQAKDATSLEEVYQARLDLLKAKLDLAREV